MYSGISLARYFSVVFKCNYLFNCKLEFKDMVLREIFGG